MLQWAAMPSSRGSSNPGIEPRSPTLQADSLPSEPPRKWVYIHIYLQLIHSVLQQKPGLPWASDGKESACDAGDQVQSLGQRDPLEKEMATRSSILVWRIPWTEEPGRLHTVHGVAKSGA